MKIGKSFWIRGIQILFILFTSFNSIGQPWDLSPLFKAARKGAKTGYEGLERIQRTSEALTSGKQLQETRTEWQKIASQFREATEKIERAPLPSDFNMELYKLDVPAINCATKQTVIISATSYLEELRKSQLNSLFLQRQTASFINTLGMTRKVLNAIHDLYNKQLGPNYQKVWSDWLDIEQYVDGDLFRLNKAANEHLKKLTLEFKKVEMKRSNLSGNLEQIKNIKCGGIFKCQDLNFPNNIINRSNCSWNLNIKDLSLSINISPDEKTLLHATLSFIDIPTRINNCRVITEITTQIGRLKKATINGSMYNIEFESSDYKLTFSGRKANDSINGSITIETLDQVRGDDGFIPYRVVHIITLTLKQ